MSRICFATEEEAREYFGSDIEIEYGDFGWYAGKDEDKLLDIEEEPDISTNKMYVIACYPSGCDRLYLGKSGVTFNLSEAKQFTKEKADNKLKYANIRGSYKWFRMLVN